MRLSIPACLVFLALPLASPLRADTPGWSSGRWFIGGGRTSLVLGRGTTNGALGRPIYIKGEGSTRRFLQRNFDIRAWHGQRMRLTVRLKSEGDAIARVGVGISETYRRGYVAIRQDSAPGGWQVHQFVMDVPSDGANLGVSVNFRGAGQVWVDEVGLEAVGRDVPLTPYFFADGDLDGQLSAASSVDFNAPSR